jgi:hypothetical protein
MKTVCSNNSLINQVVAWFGTIFDRQTDTNNLFRNQLSNNALKFI